MSVMSDLHCVKCGKSFLGLLLLILSHRTATTELMAQSSGTCEGGKTHDFSHPDGGEVASRLAKRSE